MNDYRTFAIELAQKAGEIMKANFSLGMKKEWKADHTPLTVTDTSINELVLNSIKDAYPEHSILAEEGSHLIKDSEYTWVCDPIDGTIPFSHGIPISTFTLALTRNGESIFGIIYDPYLNRLFTGEKGKGAFLHNKRIYVSELSSLAATAMNIEAFKGATYNLIGIQEKLYEKKVKLFTLCSYIYSAALVSCGELIGAIFASKTPWDVAAAKIIIDEAGGKATDLFGNDQRYDKDIKGFVASNGLVHDELLQLIKTTLKV